MSAMALKITALKKEYRDGFWRQKRLILKEISFEVPEGAMFGFLGANGAGKTTTIKILMGIQEASAGTVEILGRPATDVTTRAQLGFLPERPYFHLNLTGHEFLDFHRRLYGRAAASRPALSNEHLLRTVGIWDARNFLLRSYSKGMLQRIGVAQSLLNDPRLVILDEPMSGLDPVGRRELRDLLLELNKSGKTVFFSSHILSDIESLCQRIAFLEKGELKYFGTITDLVYGNAKQFEIIFRWKKAAVQTEIPGIGRVETFGEQGRLGIGDEAGIRPALEKLWTMGAEVVSLNPVHKTLEDALFGDKGRAAK